MTRSFFIALIVLAAFFTGTAHAQFPKYLYGVISIFNEDYEGKTTASGETYDPGQLTASHQTLPFGTELLIENLESGRKASVRIIDRGPLSDSRIMEVSREAADRLGFLKKGTVYTKITLVKVGDGKVKTPTAASSSSTSKASVAPVETETENAPAAPEVAVVAPVPAPVVDKAIAVSSAPSSVQPKVNAITRTNTVPLTMTNLVDVTNYNDLTVTNQFEIPPYEEKFIEQPVEDRKTPDMQALQDEFILEEPAEFNGGAETEKPAVKTPEPLLPLPDEKVTAEIELPLEKGAEPKAEESFIPETLSSNEEAVNIEKNESQGEALLESGKQSGKYNLVVQAGAFRKEGNALRFYDTLRNKGYEVFTSETKVRGKKWFRVRIGYFNSLDSAKQVIGSLKKSGIRSFLVKIKK